MGEVTPGVGLELVHFGEIRDALRERLGDATSFVRTPGSPPVDHYLEAGLLLSFDVLDRLVLIEATQRARPTFAGVELCGHPFGQVMDELARRGVSVETDGSGGVLEGVGIALYTPAPDEPDIEVEAVSIFSALNISSESQTSDVEAPEPASEDTLF